MKFFLVFLLCHGLFINYCSNSSGPNLYYTDSVLNNGDRHCLYYYTPERNFASQFIEYCIRFSMEEQVLNDVDDDNKNSFTFEDLYAKNITSQELYEWFAPIDLIESYQLYLENNVSTSKFHFYNCTYPWFGPRCQYYYPETKNLYDNEYDFIRSSLLTLSCYTYLQCDRTGDQGASGNACLDWREICDGKVDCIDGGYDEDLCWYLEINECDDKTEYRCQNGLCIPFAFLGDDDENPDCLDRSDELLYDKQFTGTGSYLPSFSGHCAGDPTFRCEESMCHPSTDKEYQISCGDGSYMVHGSPCNSEKDLKLFDTLWFSVNISDKCRLNMQCFSKLISGDFYVRNCPGYDEYYAKYIGMYCPKLIVLPPILFGHVRFVYTNNQSVKTEDGFYEEQSYPPDYICYDGKLCDDNLFSTFLHSPMDLLHDNSTCRSLNKHIFYNETRPEWFNVISYFYNLFRKCLNHYQPLSVSNSSNLYQCMNSSKIISQHRLLNGIEDCLYGDDETYNQSCSLENFNHRFTCDQNTNKKCLTRSRVFDTDSDCLDGSDEPRESNENLNRPISFQTICDGFTELPPMMIDGQNVTDETECTYFPCNNIYTRCDGFWNCLDGIDEINCEWPPICPLNHHMCISSLFGNVTCLSIERINDGIIDCLGASDERHNCRDSYKSTPIRRYQCSNSSTCSGVDTACFKLSVCPKYENIPGPFCQELTDSDFSMTLYLGMFFTKNLTHIQQLVITLMEDKKPIYIHFSLIGSTSYLGLQIPKVPSPRPQTRIAQNVIQSDMSINTDSAISDYCNRGIQVSQSISNESTTSIICLCPPAYYGHLCQYQSQRVSLTLQVRLSFEFRVLFVFLITLRDNEQNLIESYDRIEYLYERDCKKKFNIYLLYADRPKNTSVNHSVRIDVFNKQTLEYRASWLFPVKFSFLPVYRLAVQLQIPATKIVVQNCKIFNCSLHGQCSEYINTNIQFCLCNKGWSGTYCDIPYVCNCSSDLFCYEPNICLCPLDKYGSRCYLHHLPCPCQNNGTCVRNDERMDPKKAPWCICPEGFSGSVCEKRDTQMTLSFSSEMSIPSSIFVHFIEVFGKNQSHIRSTTPKRIALDEETVSAYTDRPFHIIFIELEQSKKYYLGLLQQKFIPSTNISLTLKPLDHCPSINEIFNQTILSLHLLRRIKYYHIPCQQSRLNLSCFYDDIHMCICDHDRQQANCLTFNHNQSYDCGDQNPCENQGRCFRDRPSCPITFLCICDDCSYGSRCQFSTKGKGLSLDIILGYHIKPHLSFTQQPLVIHITLTIVTIMVIVGVISNLLSIFTFQSKISREVGCGYYLLASSYTSLIIIILFALKFYLFLFSQMGMITNLSYLTVNCILLEYLLKVLISITDWFYAFVGIERTITVWQDAKFNKAKAKKMAKWMIVLIYIVTFLTYLHDPIHRRMIDDIEDNRSWCYVKFSLPVQLFNGLILTLHFLFPFIINIVSALIIIIRTARQKFRIQKQRSYREQLWKQVKELKHLLISPMILIILNSPRLIISSLSGCMKTTRGNPWLYILGYLISFLPAMLLIIGFILPSKTYKNESMKAIAQIRQRFHRNTV